MVLVVGLARTGQIALPSALPWMQAASGKRPRKNNQLRAPLEVGDDGRAVSVHTEHVGF